MVLFINSHSFYFFVFFRKHCIAFSQNLEKSKGCLSVGLEISVTFILKASGKKCYFVFKHLLHQLFFASEYAETVNKIRELNLPNVKFYVHSSSFVANTSNGYVL